ncbi:SCAN domain-containing protein 3-like [Myzus persicae]|uniref:SCAN domain-containing protein 3-like n=1 Tax=Myzus persicae TaxID=13164 RepID=UPI000B9399EA|nr:SCAN domain-containing protein 3-like [Myzus persicae]
MTGRISGFKAEVTKVSPDVRFVHCIIHREHLTFRKIGCELNLIMNDVVSMVNIVKTRALNTRLFKILCEDMGSNHNTLLFHTDVRWLSRGKVLKRVIELSDELRIFIREIKPDLSALLSNEKWMCLASYLADVFDKVNELNVSLQGQSTNILVLTSKLQAFNKKLSSWLSHLTMEIPQCLRIKTPFSTSLKYDHIPWSIKEQLIEIREDSTLESEFHEKELSEFWLRRQQEYPLISKAALLILIHFASTYLYETAFSQLQIIKKPT